MESLCVEDAKELVEACWVGCFPRGRGSWRRHRCISGCLSYMWHCGYLRLRCSCGAGVTGRGEGDVGIVKWTSGSPCRGAAWSLTSGCASVSGWRSRCNPKRLSNSVLLGVGIERWLSLFNNAVVSVSALIIYILWEFTIHERWINWLQFVLVVMVLKQNQTYPYVVNGSSRTFTLDDIWSRHSSPFLV